MILGAQGLTASADQLRAVAVAVVLGTPILVAAAVIAVPERPTESWRTSALRPAEALRLIAGNPALLRMVGAVLLFVSGVVLQGTLHRLILADVVGDESRFPMMLLIENLATLAAVPAWVLVSDRIGKHRALAAAALWLAFWSLPLTQIGPGDAVWLIACVAIRGSSFVAIVLLANSIAADVVDFDTAASGRQRTGLFFAVWGMVTKGALAAGVALGTSLPAAIGYVPNTELSPDVQKALMRIYGLLPALLMGGGAIFLWNFPITRERHAEVRAAIDARSAQRGRGAKARTRRPGSSGGGDGEDPEPPRPRGSAALDRRGR